MLVCCFRALEHGKSFPAPCEECHFGVVTQWSLGVKFAQEPRAILA